MNKKEKKNAKNLFVIGTETHYTRKTNRKDNKNKQNFTYVKCPYCDSYGCSVCANTGRIKI